MNAPTWAVVPLKSPGQAKTRLATVLSPAQRRHLFFALGERVIRTLQEARGIDAVAVVTADTEVADFAGSLGARVIRQAGDDGQTGAFAAAVRGLQALKLRGLLMIAGDLPLISAEAVQGLVAAAVSPGVVVVPDRRRIGTNALLCTPPEIVPPGFGGASFERHLAAAQTAGVEAQVLELDELGLDLDLPEDLEYLRLHGGSRALDLLDASGIAGSATSPRLAGIGA
jgi:2-phospho-L-lactate guanylyltransferase